VAPPSGSASRPGRALAVLAVLIVALFLTIVGGDLASPAKWHHDLRVKLGLDLTSGTTVTLKAVTPKGSPPRASEMATAVTILRNRVNASGFTEAVVDQQGSDIINVSVPGKNAQQVTSLTRAAELQFRQVLVEAPNSAPATAPTPTPSTPAGATPGATPSASASPSASPSASTKAKVSAPGQRAGQAAAAAGAARELGTGTRLTAASASPSPAATASPAASASATPSPAPTSGAGLFTWQMAAANPAIYGDPAALSAQTKALFNKLNCANPDWKQKIGYGQAQYNRAGDQTVSCGRAPNGVLYKFALAPAKVVGGMISSASASPVTTSSNAWQVNVNFKSGGTKAWGDLTTAMYDQYKGSQTAPQNQIAVVLDGTTVSFPYVVQPQVSGNSQITGNFSQSEATNLANVLSYGALPLSFNQQSVQSVSPQLGHDQLTAGLIAAGIGLLLVVFYTLLYYRGLAVVAVSSLVIAGVLAFESVVMLGKYQGYALSLAGIAGLVVAIGITADSFVVYFERLRDEVRDGRSLRAAVERGWGRARRTILVSDTVSFLAAALLYIFAIGSVRGFAFTLGLTTIIDVVVVFLFTKPMLTLLARTKFYGGGHPLSGLDPARLGARAPWRASPRVAGRTAPARAAQARSAPARSAPAKEA
jgi:preprotein translocase subunit SecD